MKFYLASIAFLPFMISCSSDIEERSENAANIFVTIAEKGEYNELAQLAGC